MINKGIFRACSLRWQRGEYHSHISFVLSWWRRYSQTSLDGVRRWIGWIDQGAPPQAVYVPVQRLNIRSTEIRHICTSSEFVRDAMSQHQTQKVPYIVFVFQWVGSNVQMTRMWCLWWGCVKLLDELIHVLTVYPYSRRVGRLHCTVYLTYD